MPGGLGRLQQFIKDPCCATFASRNTVSDFNFCPWCGTNFKDPQFLYFINPQENLTTERFMSEWYAEEGYRGFAGFRRTEQGAMEDLVKDYVESQFRAEEKNKVFVHKVDLSNAKKIELTEEHVAYMIAHFGTSNWDRERNLAENIINHKEDLLRRKV
jgi:hypothetical protein